MLLKYLILQTKHKELSSTTPPPPWNNARTRRPPLLFPEPPPQPPRPKINCNPEQGLGVPQPVSLQHLYALAAEGSGGGGADALAAGDVQHLQAGAGLRQRRERGVRDALAPHRQHLRRLVNRLVGFLLIEGDDDIEGCFSTTWRRGLFWNRPLVSHKIPRS